MLKFIKKLSGGMFFCLISSFSHAIDWEEKDHATSVLSRCGAVYDYLAQYSMLVGNEPAAKNFVANGATMSAGLVFLNRDGEKVRGERLAFAAATRKGLREEHDADIDLAFERANMCGSVLPKVVRRFGKDPSLFGLNFMEFRDNSMKHLGSMIGVSY